MFSVERNEWIQTKMILTIPFENHSSLTPIFRLNNVNDTTMQSVFPHLEPEVVELTRVCRQGN
jgi:hypothetical protein